ncbi:MAG TPA: hypothetical protein VMW50_02465 [Dehalococcoidia bacterium]|nr:hypothetical protein [Dehalococcoidia bacterium]
MERTAGRGIKLTTQYLAEEPESILYVSVKDNDCATVIDVYSEDTALMLARLLIGLGNMDKTGFPFVLIAAIDLMMKMYQEEGAEKEAADFIKKVSQLKKE